MFSVIIPVYARPDEIAEMLESLSRQTVKDFEVIIAEDDRVAPSEKVVEKYRKSETHPEGLTIQYLRRPGTGRSERRNLGMDAAKGDYFLFFDSDCILPPTYMENLKKALDEDYCDAFGGPDNALESFTPVQKAINYAMTSFFTTGGIRGSNRHCAEKFHPRSFNMGFSPEVYRKVGGFLEMWGEDIDLSIRIHNAGFKVRLVPSAFVYHKRRVNFKKFFKQVFNFGKARIVLYQKHPDSLKLVHLLPSCFLLGELGLIVFSIVFSPLWLLFLGFYFGLIFFHSTWKNRSLYIGLLSIATSFIQLNAYGAGFIIAFFSRVIFGKKLEQGEELLKKYN